MTYVLSDHTWGSRDHPQGVGVDLQGAAPPRDNFRVGVIGLLDWIGLDYSDNWTI